MNEVVILIPAVRLQSPIQGVQLQVGISGMPA